MCISPLDYCGAVAVLGEGCCRKRMVEVGVGIGIPMLVAERAWQLQEIGFGQCVFDGLTGVLGPSAYCSGVTAYAEVFAA